MDELLSSWGETQVMGADQVIVHLLLSFALGQLLAWVYLWTHKGMSYSRSQMQSLVLLALIVTCVMLAVGNNLARAFGLFGALALIRFRTPVKDPRDTAFLFMSVGIGISVGAHQFMLAAIGTVFMGLVALYMARSGFGERFDRNAVLRFMFPAGADPDAGLSGVLRRHCRSVALVQLREAAAQGSMEFAYQLTLHDPEDSPLLLDELRGIPGVSGLNLFMQDDGVEP